MKTFNIREINTLIDLWARAELFHFNLMRLPEDNGHLYTQQSTGIYSLLA